MRLLMNKFRIPVRDVVVIKDVTTPPTAATRAWFDSMTKNLVRREPGNTSGIILNLNINDVPY